jgi:hypothetical protein
MAFGVFYALDEIAPAPEQEQSGAESAVTLKEVRARDSVDSVPEEEGKSERCEQDLRRCN